MKKKFSINRKSTNTASNVRYLEKYRPSTSVTDWKSIICGEINDIRLGSPDYDFNGVPNPLSFDMGEEIIQAMPATLIEPALDINADGTLLIEWVKREVDGTLTMLSIIPKNNEIIYSLMHAGNVKSFGVLNFSSESLDILRSRLAKYFENYFNSQTSVR